MEIPEKILNKLNDIPHTEGVLFTGSRSLGEESKNSDWDFYILLKDGAPRWRKTWRTDNTWVEVFCNDAKQTLKDFKDDIDSGCGVTLSMLTAGNVISDTKGTLKKLQKRARVLWRNGPRLTNHRKQWIDYDIATYIQDIEDCIDDNKPALLLTNYALNEFVNYYYRLGRVWIPRQKDKLSDLKKRNRKLFKLILRINTLKDWEKKARLTIAAGKLVAQKYGLNLNGEEYSPPKNK